ncbi:hypothetical protein BHE74_00043019 [Ensete ventricosum]|nr:hypothetical protein GW17_00052993 [Ensete ventricosum]RWW50702.1 hypothetical protein BHE74_00043019 [Ensete ventricosum]
MMGQDQAWASDRVRMMQWDLAGCSLGDSSKGSGSLLGTRREITGRLAARMPEAVGLTGASKLLVSDGCTTRTLETWRLPAAEPPGRRVNRSYLVFGRLTTGKSPRLGG